MLVASGHGQHCNQLKTILKDRLWQVDMQTGKIKLVILKYNKKTMPADYERLSKELAVFLLSYFKFNGIEIF